MEQEIVAGEFWLPPEFLTDEDILMDFPTAKPNSGTPTETESDEEDYLNGLNSKLATITLQDDFWKFDAIFESNYNKSGRIMSGSPQSTLCGCKNGSSRGSPNCPSPPATAAEAYSNQTSWDLLYAAAGELARMRMVEEAASRYYNPNKNHPPPRKIGTHDLYYQQLQIAQFQKLKQQQIAKQQYLQMMLQSRSRNETGNSRPAVSSVPAWPALQQSQQQPAQRPPGSGMRAVFLGNPSTKRESTGTGVFLPRQTGAPTEPFKKRGCSTVLLPDRVVQALNLNLEAMEGESKLQSRCNDSEAMYRNRFLMGQQRGNNISHRQQSPAAMADFRLPQEWTY